MKKKSFIKDLIETVLTSLVIVFILINFILKPVLVDGKSMYPTLENKDYGYTFVFTKLFGIKRFDLVVIDVEEKLIVKRVIGLPNDKITFFNNELYVNDVKFDEPYLNDDAYTNELTITLNDDEYFCLGDNRSISKDSRFYGPFSKDEIVSNNIFIIYPFKHFGVKK